MNPQRVHGEVGDERDSRNGDALLLPQAAEDERGKRVGGDDDIGPELAHPSQVVTSCQEGKVRYGTQ